MKRFTSAWLAVCLTCSFSTSSLAVNALETRAFQGMPADFIKSADISTLLDAEKHGVTFYDQNNQRKDPIAVLKESGVNYVRLRLWVGPQSTSGEGYGGGNNDLTTTLTLAKRVKAQGVKLLLDFHYSDSWTDPGKQFKPKAWEEMGYPQLKTAIHDYTHDTIARFKQADVLPDVMQIGSEINGGILWSEGKSRGQGGGGFDWLAGLLNAAIAGLEENLHHGEQTKIVLHLTEGTKNDTFRWWFDEIGRRHMPYDVIGLSIYTHWDSPISALKASMDDIGKHYSKDVIVAEAAYVYTLTNCDNAENNPQTREERDGGYPTTVQGQYHYIHGLMQAVIDVPDQRGKGIFYWEPTWVAVPGDTWATPARMKYIHDEWKEGNAHKNQALFNCQEKVLLSIKIFN